MPPPITAGRFRLSPVETLLDGDFTQLTPDCFGLAESPLWDRHNGALLWVDIPAGDIHELQLKTGVRRRWHLPGSVGSLGLARSGRVVVARRAEVGLLTRDSGAYETLATLFEDSPDLRLNDGKMGPDGAFWVGSMDDKGLRRPIAALYRVQADGKVEQRVDGLITSNGLAWSAGGGVMYHSDSRGCWIDAWAFDPATGSMGGRRRLATPDDAAGRPDGAATDVGGAYWSCGVSAGCLNRYGANGVLLARIELPVPAPTMPCFGGDDMKSLFVTSLRHGLSDAQLAGAPAAGALLQARVNVAGVPVAEFAD